MLVLLLGLFIIGGGATILSIVITFPLTSSTLLFRNGILPYVCLSHLLLVLLFVNHLAYLGIPFGTLLHVAECLFEESRFICLLVCS